MRDFEAKKSLFVFALSLPKGRFNPNEPHFRYRSHWELRDISESLIGYPTLWIHNPNRSPKTFTLEIFGIYIKLKGPLKKV